MRRGWRAGAVCALACAALAAGCARIPDEGPLVEESAPVVPDAAAPFNFSPPGPEPGATPEQVVAGFLTAQQATPLTTTVAAEYLTERAADSWHPERRTLLFGDQTIEGPPSVPSARSPLTVPVSLRRVFALDRAGRWEGRQRDVERGGLRISLVREAGEWRLQDPPDALVLPLTHFENRYRRFDVYFADPSGRLLVPEPVYHPLEVQTPSQLVDALLAGPRGTDQAVERSYIPPRTELVVSVPLSDDGVASVPLTADLLDLPPRELLVAAAQIVWTLRQVPGVQAVRLTAEGEPVTVPGVGQVVPVDALPQFSPLVAAASSDLYGLRRDTVQRVTAGRESTFLRLPRNVRAVDLGVSLLGNPLAVSDGRAVHVLARGSDARGRATPVESLVTGPVTRPLWDWSRALWLVPRRFDGEVRVALGGEVVRLRWDVPAASGREVRAATMSRDGTRLVVAIRRPAGGSRLLMARVLRSPDSAGKPLALRSAGVVEAGAQLRGLVDLGWRDTTTLAVLARPDRVSSRVLAVPVDGQRASGVLLDDSEVLFGRAVAMAASPETEQVRVTTTAGDQYVLSPPGRWRLVAGDRRPLRSPTYVG